MRRLVPQLLGEASFSTPPVIERCHCTDVKDNSRAKGPRPMLVKFHFLQDKLKIMKLSREKTGPLQYEGARVNIYSDFSAGLVQRRRGFDEAKKKLHDQGIKYAFIFPCTLRVVQDILRYISFTLLMKLRDSLVGFPPLTPPLTLK